MRRTFLLLLVVLLPMVASAYDAKINGIYYNFSGNEATVTYEYTSDGWPISTYSGNVVIPSTVTYSGKTYTVTSIGSSAFYWCSLTSITIPNSVTSIGSDNFWNCIDLTSVTLNSNAIVSASRTSSKSLKDIFGSHVKTYILGEDVKSIGSYAFYGCSSLPSITIPSGVTSIGDYAFDSCSSLTSITIPNSVTSIGGYAFGSCSSLTSVTLNSNAIVSASRTSSTSMKSIFGNQVQKYQLGETVKAIGNYAFYGCSGLTSFAIPSSVTSIGSYAFSGCTGLPSITIPSSITNIGSYAFYNCSKLKKVIVPDIAAWCGISFGSNTANPLYYTQHIYCNESTEIKDLVIPNSVKSISNYAFYGCSSLTSITIPSSVTSIGSNAFYCKNLKEVYSFAKNVPSTQSSAFYGSPIETAKLHVPASSINSYKATSPWSNFGTISIMEEVPDDFAYIDGIYYNFMEDKAIVTSGERKYVGAVIIPQSVTYRGKTYPVTGIGSGAFYYCTELASVSIPKSVTSIGENVFHGCISLTGIVVAQGNSIYDSRDNCNAIIETSSNTLVVGCKNTIIPNSVNTIRGQAFYECRLTSITIPNSVNTIGYYAFGLCTELEQITIGSGVSYLDEHAFEGCTSLTSVTLEGSTFLSAKRSQTTSMKSFFGEQVKEYVLGNSVQTIGDYAFYGCENLSAIIIPENVTRIGNYAFAGCKLYNILTKCTTPPIISRNTFSEQTLYHIMLYIPTDCWSTYIYDNVWYLFHNIRETVTTEEQVSIQQAYTLMDASTFAYTVYDPVNDCIGTINSVSGIDENNPNHSWQVIEADGEQYLYNVGAKKFVVSSSDGSFMLSSTPSSIEIENGSNGIIIGTQKSRQWALVSNDRLSAERAIITGVSPLAETEESAAYDLSGRKLDKAQKGINIIRMGNGTTRKVMMK